MSKHIYLNVHDAMRKQKFPVFIPEWYTPAGMPEYFVHYQTLPVYNPQENNMCKSQLTPDEMVTAIEQQVPIEFAQEGDIALVETIMNKYYDEIKNYRNQDKDVDVYLDNLAAAIKEVGRGVKRLTQVRKGEGQYVDTSKSHIEGILERSNH